MSTLIFALRFLLAVLFLSYCFSRFYFKVINPFNSIFFSITHIERKEGFRLSFHLPHTFLYLWVWRLLITVTYFYVTHPGRLKLKLKITVPRFYVIHFECFNSTWRAKNTFHLFYVIAGWRGVNSTAIVISDVAITTQNTEWKFL